MLSCETQDNKSDEDIRIEEYNKIMEEGKTKIENLMQESLDSFNEPNEFNDSISRSEIDSLEWIEIESF